MTIKYYFSHRENGGFSLLEMLVVLSLIAITCHYVLGKYQFIVARGYRQLAELTLLQAAASMEDYAAENFSYHGATLAKLNIHRSDIDKHYLLQIKNTTPDYFLLAATPQGMQAKVDTCGILMLDSTGRKTSSTHDNNCW